MKKVYNYEMIRSISLFSTPLKIGTICLLTLALVSCSSNQKSEDLETESAKNALETIATIVTPKREIPRPGAMLGIFATLYAERTFSFGSQTALRGLGASLKLQEEDRMTLDETFTLLQALGASLQVNVPNLLNQSQNRAEALNSYTASLNDVTKRSAVRKDALEAEIKALQEKERTEREAVTALERQISQALSSQEYGTAGSLQKPLAEAEAILSKTTSETERARDIMEVFRKLLDIAEKRIVAIEQNRQVIIAGLTVVDLPGIEDLGILRDPDGRTRRDETYPLGPFGL